MVLAFHALHNSHLLAATTNLPLRYPFLTPKFPLCMRL